MLRTEDCVVEEGVQMLPTGSQELVRRARRWAVKSRQRLRGGGTARGLVFWGGVGGGGPVVLEAGKVDLQESGPVMTLTRADGVGGRGLVGSAGGVVGREELGGGTTGNGAGVLERCGSRDGAAGRELSRGRFSWLSGRFSGVRTL